MFVPRSTCFQAPCHVYAYIYMPMFSLPCFCLDLHANAQIYVFMLNSMCLCAPCQACMLKSILVAMPCATLALFFPPLISFFLAFWPFWWGVGLNPMVQSYILTPRPILKGLGHFLCMSMFAYLLLYFIYMLASLDLGFAMFCALCGFVLLWLHLSFLGFVRM